MYPVAVSELDEMMTELHPPPAWMMEAPWSSWAAARDPMRIIKRKIKRNREVIDNVVLGYYKINQKMMNFEDGRIVENARKCFRSQINKSTDQQPGESERVPDGQVKQESVKNILCRGKPVLSIGGIGIPKRESDIEAEDEKTEIET